MTEADYVWLTNPNLPDSPVIRIADGSQWHYAQGGWVETDPVPDLTAADIEAAEVETETEADEEEAPEAEQEAEPDTEPDQSDQEESE